MLYRTLGRTGLSVSIMGMGTGGGPDPLGQKSGIPEAEIHRLLHRAFELGINFFDTAPGYMESEVILGRALHPLPRNRLVVSTKIALASNMPGEPFKVMTPGEIEAAIDTSLRRLQTDYVDLLLIGVASTEHFDFVMQDQLPVLQRIQEAGKVRFLGSTELSRADGAHLWLQKLLPTGAWDVAMFAHNMINQSAQRSVLPICRRLNIGALNVFTVRRIFGVPGRLEEVLAGLKARGQVPADLPADNPLGWLLRDGDVETVIEAAYRYAAHTDGVTAVMNGANEIPMLEQNVASVLKGPLEANKIERLRSLFGRVAEVVGN